MNRSAAGEGTADRSLVSVVTATYNRAHYLPGTIGSVLRQTYPHLEYHVVDDGSTDNTKEVIAPYLLDPRLKYHVQSNRGQAVARNVGLAHSKGEYLCFLDSDNLWEPDKVESQLREFEANPEADVIYGDIQAIDEAGSPLNIPNMKRHSGRITEMLLRDNFVTFNTAMIRRKCYEELGGLDERIFRADDYEFFLRYSTRYRFLYVPKVCVQYRIQRNQISSNKEARFESNRSILENFMAQHPELLSEETRKTAWCHFYTRRGRSRAATKDFRGAWSDHLRAIGYRPTAVVPWRAFLRLLLLWK
jgi:glycosyltransferase involved in cell wall biosynthesis